MSEWDEWEDRLWWNPQRPRRVEGGVRSRPPSGEAGRRWWTQAWLRLLEGVRYGASLELGAKYARAGQVIELQVETGEATALVQGSRPKPYRVRLRVPALPRADWQKLEAELTRQVAWTARLLNRDLPREIEQFCQRSQIALLPESAQQLRAECNCPNQTGLCKHVGAIWMLLADEMDRDPLLLFRLRGIDREELTAILRPAGSTPTGAAPAKKPAAEPPAAPGPAGISRFWQGSPIDPALLGDLPPSTPFSPALQRLGPFPFWQGDQSLEELLRPLYLSAAEAGRRWWLGEEEDEDETT